MRSSTLAVVLAGTVLAAGVATAASLRISPIGLELKGSQRAASLSLTNVDSQPVSVQIRLFRWSQVGAEEKLEPATDMIVNPPVATIPGGASYTVRVARLAARPAPQELSYRLIIDEIPKPVDPNNPNQGVSMVLRTSMPVFVADDSAKAKLGWTAWQDAQGLHVQVVNSGQRHAKLADLALTADGGQPVSFGKGLNGYVLAGATRQFDLKRSDDKALPSLAGASVALTAQNIDQPVKERVVVETR